MGPIKRAWKAAGRPTASSFMLLVVAGVIAVCVARTWAQPLPPCKTPAVYQEIAKLQNDKITAQGILDRAHDNFFHDDYAYKGCLLEQKRNPKIDCSSFREARSSSSLAEEKAEHNVRLIENRLEALYALPNCPEPATPPPPPPPHPAPTPTPAPTSPPKLPPPGAEVHHRQTSCRPACDYAETALNNAIDDYNKYSRSSLAASYYQSMMNRSQELDECEKKCVGPPNNPVMTVPGPRLQPPQRSPDSGRPLFDWGPYTVPNRPGSVLPQRPTENTPAPR